METAFSGYCRSIDAPRLVFCEADGEALEVECDYMGCAYAADCPIGCQIAEFLKQNEEADG